MRKSKSLLNNVSSSRGANPEAYSPYHANSEIMAHADQIQQRFNPYGQAVAGPGYPSPYGYPHSVQPHPGYAQAFPHTDMHHPANTAEYQGVQAQQLQGLRSNLENLSTKLNMMMQAQAARKQDRSENELVVKQLGALANSVHDLNAAFAGFQQNSVQPSQIDVLRDAIDQNYQQILSRLNTVEKTEIDPSAYAKAVEASHADIINQVREMQSLVQSNNEPADNFLNAVETSYAGLGHKIDQLAVSLSAMENQPRGEGSEQLKSQLAGVEKAIASMVGKEISVPAPDLSRLEMQLEEVNRAIVALSSVDTATDNLDRIEARLIDLSRELDGLAAREVSTPEAPDLSWIENHFTETGNALRQLEARFEKNAGETAPSFDELFAEVKNLGEKVENLAVVSTGSVEETQTGTSSALLERLDVLATREMPQPEPVDFSGLEGRLEQIEARITDQLGKSEPDLDGIATELQKLGEKVDSMAVAAAAPVSADPIGDPEMLGRVNQLIERVDQVTSGDRVETDAGLLQSLHEQISGISEQLGSFSTSLPNLDPITESLGNIEQQLGASRDISIELAAGAAEEALRRVIQEMPVNGSSVDPEIITALHQDIQRLNESVAPAGSAEVPLDDIRETMNLIVDRLGSLEKSIGSINAPAPAAVMQPAPDHEVTPVAQNPAPVPEQAPVERVLDTPALAEPTQAQMQPVSGMMDQPLDAELEEMQDNPHISAGEQLVKAARMVEQERMRVKQEHEEEIAATPASIDFTDSLAAHAHSLAEEQRSGLPEMPAPNLAPEQMQEAYPGNENFQPASGEIDEDTIIEPGSSGPDLADLVKQASQRSKTMASREEGVSGTDFLAQARKAAQAAALEASVAEAEAEAAAAKPQKSKNLLGALPSLITKRKKAIVIAAAAALLIAIAVPLVSKFAFNSNPVDATENAATSQYQEPLASLAENTDLSQERVSLVSDFVEEETDVSYTEPEVQEANLESPEVSTEQTASISAPIEPLPFELSKIDFVSGALKAAAEQNDPAAVFEIGRRLTNGIGTGKNLEEAAKWYEHAANLGFIPAQYLIGNFNEKGIGVEQDRILAEAWYEQAAESGHVIAMHNLAVLNASPDPATGKNNLEKSYKWFAKAAEHGVRDSQVNLGIFLAKGTGVPVDLVESYKWFAIAAKSGDADAGQKRDFIADAMRPDQLEEARKRVENWKQIEPDAAANDVSIPDSWKNEEDKLALLTDQNSIAQAQTLLTKLGFDPGPADGVMGKKTRDAIAAFRAKSGLSVNDHLDIEFMETLRAVSI